MMALAPGDYRPLKETAYLIDLVGVGCLGLLSSNEECETASSSGKWSLSAFRISSEYWVPIWLISSVASRWAGSWMDEVALAKPRSERLFR